MKTITSVITLSICATALSACTTVKVLGGVEVRCPLKPNSKITADEGQLVVRDKMVPVCRTDSVRLTFKEPMPAMNRARTLPKDPANGWLGAIYDGQAITITVPLNTPPGEYGYIIEVDGIGRLDPRFVVQ